MAVAEIDEALNRAPIGRSSALLKAAPTTRGTYCALLRDGRLFGPFETVAGARYWCAANGLDCYSTYDLLAPLSYSGEEELH